MRYTEEEKNFKALYNSLSNSLNALKKNGNENSYLTNYLDGVVNYMHEFYNKNIATENNFLVIDVLIYRCVHSVRKSIKKSIDDFPSDVFAPSDSKMMFAKRILGFWVHEIDATFNVDVMEKLDGPLT